GGPDAIQLIAGANRHRSRRSAQARARQLTPQALQRPHQGGFVEPVRDLGRIEPWQESLERSLARRGKSRRASVSSRPRPARRRSARPRALVLGGGVIVALASSLAVLPSALAGGGTEARHLAAEARLVSVPVHPVDFGPAGGAPEPPRLVPRRLDGGLARTCRPATWQRDYVNPLAHARVKPERIDQG